MQPVVMTIAGSDPSGGSGIQLDLSTLEAWDCHAVSALTALTVQDTRAVHRVVVMAPELVREQIEALFADLPIAAVKTGMLGDAGVVRAVAAALTGKGVPFVCDPVLQSTSGAELLPSGARPALVEALLPLATLVTPNATEAAYLVGHEVNDPDEAVAAAEALMEQGAAAVLVKGGHFVRECGTDVLVTAAGSERWPPSAQPFPPTRGTGCMLASSVAARLAWGDDLRDAIGAARTFVANAARHGRVYGDGTRIARPGCGVATETS